MAVAGLVTTPFHLRMIAEDLSLRRSWRDAGKLNKTLGSATIDLNPHQVEAAVFAFKSPLSRGAILADEVGLGKTIEAGLVIAQLVSEGKRRVLILTPATIREQWRNEMEDRFGLAATIMDGPLYTQVHREGIPNPYDDDRRPIIISSIPFAYNRADDIQKAPWDLVVIDEAHYLRNVWRSDNKMARRLHRALRGHPKLLVTATPLQNDLMELYGLVSFIDDRLLGTPYSFRALFALDEKGRDPTRQELLRERLSTVVIRTLRRQVREYVQFTERHSWSQDFTPYPAETALYDRVSEYLRRPALAAIGRGQRPLMIMIYRKLLASSSFAIAGTLQSLIHTLQERLKGTEAPPYPGAHDYHGFAEDAEAARAGPEEEAAAGRFTRAEIREEIAELRACLDMALRIRRNAKGEALKVALARAFEEAERRDWPRKAVIFTESRRTQSYLHRLLEKAGYTGRITLFHGSSGNAIERRALVREFEERTSIFLATRAGAEGLNLQFCNFVINYDLPWNPQRIEQRIGRCHRYGQKLDVMVINFLNRSNAADQRLLELLEHKLQLFEGLFGQSDEVLGALSDGLDFERRICDIYQSCRTEDEINRAFDQLQQELEETIRSRLRETRRLLLEHFDDEVRLRLRAQGREIHVQMSEQERMIKTLVLGYLGPERWVALDEPEIYHLRIPRELKDSDGMNPIVRADPAGIRATFARADSGTRSAASPAQSAVLHLHAGHPLVEAIATKLRQEETPLLHNVRLEYTEGGHRITSMVPLLGRRGFWLVYRLTLEGLDVEDRLIHVVLIQREDGFSPLAQEIVRHLPTITASPAEMSEPPLSPRVREIADGELARVSAEAARSAELENEEFFDRELDKLDRYTEESLLEGQERLNRLRGEWDEAKKRKDRAPLGERRALRSEIQRLEREYVNQMRRLDGTAVQNLREKAARQKRLEERLPVRVTHRLVAVARWEMR